MSSAPRRHLLLLFAISLLLYLPSLFGDFVFDDHYLLEQNATLHTSAGIHEAFTEDYYGQANPRYALGYYRPLALLSHWLDWQIWKAAPFGHHLTNVLLHCAVVVILYLLIAALFQDRALAFLTAVLFAAHPSHASTITFISGRVDALATFFALLSLLIFMKRKAAAAIPYFAALLSKEISVTLPILALWNERSHGWRTALKAMIPFAAALATAIALRLLFLQRAHTSLPSFSPGALQNALEALSAYLRFLVLPPLSLYLEPAPGQMPLWINIATALIFAAALYFQKSRKVAGWSLIWLVTLLPVLGVVKLETFVDERFLYLPSVSFCLLAAAWLLQYLRSRVNEGVDPTGKPVLAAGVVIVLLYAPVLLARQAQWMNDLSLWSAAVKTAPQSPQIRLRLGVAHLQAGELAEAEQQFTAGLSLPQDAGILTAALYTHLATVRQMQGSNKDVEQLYRKSLQLDPQYYTARFNLGLYYRKAARLAEAIVEFEAAVRSNPKSAPAHRQLGELLQQQGRNAEARQHLDEAARLSGN